MLKSKFGRAAAGIAAAVFALSIAACSSGSGEAPGGAESGSQSGTSALPPVMATPAELPGKTFEITKERPLVITVDNAHLVAEWTGQAEDEAVAKFAPGRDDGGAQFNPGFDAVGSGTTEASVTSPEGETFEFTITVP